MIWILLFMIFYIVAQPIVLLFLSNGYEKKQKEKHGEAVVQRLKVQYRGCIIDRSFLINGIIFLVFYVATVIFTNTVRHSKDLEILMEVCGKIALIEFTAYILLKILYIAGIKVLKVLKKR